MSDILRPPKRPKFELNWTDEDSAWVWGTFHTSEGPLCLKVGTLGWNGGQWFFWRVAPDGDVVTDGGHYIPTDPNQETIFRNEEAQARLNQNEAVREALLAEIRGRWELLRDETRDLAAYGAKIEARRWLPDFIHELELGDACRNCGNAPCTCP